MTCPNCNPATTADKIAAFKETLMTGPLGLIPLFKKLIEIVEELEKEIQKRPVFSFTNVPLNVPPVGGWQPWPNPSPFQPPYPSPTAPSSPSYPTPFFPTVTCKSDQQSVSDATGVSDETPGHFE